MFRGDNGSQKVPALDLLSSPTGTCCQATQDAYPVSPRLSYCRRRVKLISICLIQQQPSENGALSNMNQLVSLPPGPSPEPVISLSLRLLGYGDRKPGLGFPISIISKFSLLSMFYRECVFCIPINPDFGWKFYWMRKCTGDRGEEMSSFCGYRSSSIKYLPDLKDDNNSFLLIPPHVLQRDCTTK